MSRVLIHLYHGTKVKKDDWLFNNADIFDDRDLAAAVLHTSLAKRLREETNALSTSKKRVKFANDIKSEPDASDGNNFLEKLGGQSCQSRQSAICDKFKVLRQVVRGVARDIDSIEEEMKVFPSFIRHEYLKEFLIVTVAEVNAGMGVDTYIGMWKMAGDRYPDCHNGT
ncbi:uncharacterized protein GLRG_08082 [Colletotrichum graminicola M1.001]|uniref:Uncharacterized protein n=1 Tax=Colletotrichum graminicola (strain M1.001 / M2 / FGSC 10212) TaxID=645133 RepID=E3QQ00_COLGM|nr:uncharacterized protein GLRG_08082 [Colletotrichum graminicola M1.001]EFQ32938.1 hypothetical protein GLRG_08082 [Colletotrichum graminicola M1.001]